jgi:DNA-binding response OmpR family regulator
MPETLEDLIMIQPPTAERPLLGTMILLVEDSRHACEALRLICHRSGARIRRAESLASAARHLRSYRPRVAVIDLGLPDGSGLDLIATLAKAEPAIDGIIATSGDDTLADAAKQAGAHVFLPKPLTSIRAFQSAVLALLPKDQRPAKVAQPKQDRVEPDPVALRDDLALVSELLHQAPDAKTLDYLSNFLTSLGKDACDSGLQRLAEDLRKIGEGAGDQALAEVTRTIEDRMKVLAGV